MRTELELDKRTLLVLAVKDLTDPVDSKEEKMGIQRKGGEKNGKPAEEVREADCDEAASDCHMERTWRFWERHRASVPSDDGSGRVGVLPPERLAL